MIIFIYLFLQFLFLYPFGNINEAHLITAITQMVFWLAVYSSLLVDHLVELSITVFLCKVHSLAFIRSSSPPPVKNVFFF